MLTLLNCILVCLWHSVKLKFNFKLKFKSRVQFSLEFTGNLKVPEHFLHQIQLVVIKFLTQAPRVIPWFPTSQPPIMMPFRDTVWHSATIFFLKLPNFYLLPRVESSTNQANFMQMNTISVPLRIGCNSFPSFILAGLHLKCCKTIAYGGRTACPHEILSNGKSCFYTHYQRKQHG